MRAVEAANCKGTGRLKKREAERSVEVLECRKRERQRTVEELEGRSREVENCKGGLRLRYYSQDGMLSVRDKYCSKPKYIKSEIE